MTWDELSQASLDEIVAWAHDQPWCRAMADCQQDAGWHAEGDVWTHTKMVCAQLPQLAEWPTLTPHERTVLIFTALFHDSAKPLTSQVDPATGRITSPKHAIKGEHLARSVLRDLGCDLAVREEIARMVRFHGRPAFLLEKSESVERGRVAFLVGEQQAALPVCAGRYPWAKHGRDGKARGELALLEDAWPRNMIGNRSSLSK